MSHCCKYIINYSKSSTSDKISTTNNNNHLYHDYSFDSPKSNRQQRVISPRMNQIERSLSPRKFHVSIIKSISLFGWEFKSPIGISNTKLFLLYLCLL
jgi:hypothetical protein